jgi:pyruvate carboxylase
VTGTYSKYRGLAPALCPANPPVPPTFTPKPKPDGWTNAKKVLDAEGPDALAKWVIAQKKVLLTDTTMRDAHQSLLATRVRNLDLVEGGKIANEVLRDAFSFEAWGGATFDVCMRFLDECPWDRLRALRAACPDVCLQMLIRGSNAVGYTSYPDNVVSEFIRLAALNGMDVFRIFDCFNDIDSMDVSIKAVIAAGKVAEVCLCYTGDVLTSKIYDLAYYQSVAVQAVKAGAHMIGIKDMSGLLRPLEAGPLLAAIRAVAPGVPVHFHTHSTSSVSLATCFEMARNNCDIIDFCTASMADGTSQPSLNAFVAMMQGASNDTGINYLDLESYDVYWARCRDMYEPFESGMKSGSARVFEHQVPGGQYSNLLVQCKSMGIQAKWEEVLDAYRDVNKLFGDIIKVTPSSKCVGDLALYLVTRSLTTADLLDPSKASSIDFPESVVGLLKGDLGFPHKGFPQNVEDAILKGTPRRTVRAGLALVPADFTAHLEGLGKRWGRTISPEEGMSSLMYPQVFTDFMTRREQKGLLLKRLPTPVYLYGLLPGESFTMSSVPASEVKDALVSCAGASADVCITLKRIGPLKGGNMRSILFTVNGKDQQHEVKDSSGKFEFEGPMADSKKAGQIGSPMPGSVEKLLVAEGQLVAAGETLCTISAMKMEVKVTSPFEGKVVGLNVAAGTRVVEGALLLTLAPA